MGPLPVPTDALCPWAAQGQFGFPCPAALGFSLPNLCAMLSGSIFFQEELLANEQDCKCLFYSAKHEWHPTAEHRWSHELSQSS